MLTKEDRCMARPASGKEVLTKAKDALAKARTVEELVRRKQWSCRWNLVFPCLAWRS